MTHVDTRPLLPAEHEWLSAFLSGEAEAFHALRLQLESLTYRSPLCTSQRVWRFHLPWMAVRRSRGRLKYHVGFGYGAEDYHVGERRELFLRDVVAVLDDGTYLFGQLRLHHGRLQESTFLGTTGGPGEPLRKAPRSLRGQTIDRILFCDPWDPTLGHAPEQLFEQRRISEPYPTFRPGPNSELTSLQSFLLELDSLTVNCSDWRLPLRFRRARPASEEEIRAFEQEHDARIPVELRDLWSISNGCSFFGAVMQGTYDPIIYRDRLRGRTRYLVFMQNMESVGDYIVIDLDEANLSDKRSHTLVSEIDIETPQIHRQWSSLEDCLREIVQERRQGEEGSQ